MSTATMTSLFDKDVSDVPESVLSHPGLITANERALLFRLARDHFRGSGLIIDAGVLFGASTVAFAEGLIASGRQQEPTRPIRSYDIAIWFKRMGNGVGAEVLDEIFGDRIPGNGESFEPELRRLLSPYDGLVDLVVGNIMETAKVERPIEIAFFDCLKTNKRDLAALRSFAPHYIPGHTIVLQQDYFYWSAAHNKIRQEYFADYFEFLGAAATTAVFKLVKEIPESEIFGDPVAKLPLARQVELLKQASSRTEQPRHRIITELSLVEHLIDAGEFAWARDELDAHEAVLSAPGARKKLSRRPEQIASQMRKRIDKEELEMERGDGLERPQE